MTKTKELRLGSFFNREVFIQVFSDTEEHCDIFYGKNYENWNDLRLSCDICNEHSCGGLKINYGVLKAQSHMDMDMDKEKEIDGNKEIDRDKERYFLLNDVRIVDEDAENNREFHMATYWECSDVKHFPDLFKLRCEFEQLWNENPTHYNNTQHCEENPPTYRKFKIKYDRSSMTSTFTEYTFENSETYDQFVANNFEPEYVSICGTCRAYLQIFRPDIPFVQSHPLKYFWHKFYAIFGSEFIFKSIEDKHYIESEVFKPDEEAK